jgi:hypothetical protein
MQAIAQDLSCGVDLAGKKGVESFEMDFTGGKFRRRKALAEKSATDIETMSIGIGTMSVENIFSSGKEIAKRDDFGAQLGKSNAA